MSKHLLAVLRWISLHFGDRLVAIGEFLEDIGTDGLGTPFFWTADKILDLIDWIDEEADNDT